jgi:hypothetical protein
MDAVGDDLSAEQGGQLARDVLLEARLVRNHLDGVEDVLDRDDVAERDEAVVGVSHAVHRADGLDRQTVLNL